MIHPLVLGITATDAVALMLLLAAAVRGERVLRGWQPGAATAGQLALERGMEAASLLARGGALLLVLSSMGLLLAVTAVLPEVVPGAMCGTGVITATEGGGAQALTLRGLSLLMLGGWFVFDRLDASCAQAPLAPLVGLALVVAAPMVLWAVAQTGLALWSLDTHEAVDCCAALYAEAGGVAGSGMEATEWGTGVFMGGAVLLMGAWIYLWRRPTVRGLRLAPWVLGALLWGLLAHDVLVRRLAAYHYEVLAHHCPWCLFLPEHGAVGYPLYGALAVVMLEAVSVAAAAFACRTQPEVSAACQARVKTAGLRISLAVLLFCGLSLGPALLWWWRFGVWMR